MVARSPDANVTRACVVEDVEEAAVEDRVESLAERRQIERVGDDEADGHRAVAGLGLGELDGGRREIDPDGGQAEVRGHDRVLAGPAADVEDATDERAGVSERLEGRLRSADVPRRSEALVHRVEPCPRRRARRSIGHSAPPWRRRWSPTVVVPSPYDDHPRLLPPDQRSERA